jgi:cation:H+ antiporter
MVSDLLLLAAMLGLILVASELFTNALEHVGDELGISEGVTGSVFAAVGTALPETMIPLLAVMAGSGDVATSDDIGIGAILGASLMLSTLSTFLMAASALRSRGFAGRIAPERSGFVRDLNFFIGAIALAIAAMVVPDGHRFLRGLMSLALVTTYFVYLLLTIGASARLVAAGHGTRSTQRLFLTRLGLPRTRVVAAVQLALALALLVGGAQGFIDGIQAVSAALGISALVLSLLVIPIATELPEKINSITWLARGKDTLAFGNITGAMVFQGTLLPAIGIMFTPWQPRFEVVAGASIALAAALWLRLNAGRDGPRVGALVVNGGLYLVYLALALGVR